MDWINRLDEQAARAPLIQEQRMRESIEFEEMADRHFQALVARLKDDVVRLNKNSLIRAQGEIRVNRRDLLPDDDRTLFIDRLAFPVILLDIRLSVGSRSICLRQEGFASPEDEGSVTSKRLSLERSAAGRDILIRDDQGNALIIKGACEYILKRFAPLCP
jgi:hypothetical protein